MDLIFSGLLLFLYSPECLFTASSGPFSITFSHQLWLFMPPLVPSLSPLCPMPSSPFAFLSLFPLISFLLLPSLTWFGPLCLYFNQNILLALVLIKSGNFFLWCFFWTEPSISHPAFSFKLIEGDTITNITNEGHPKKIMLHVDVCARQRQSSAKYYMQPPHFSVSFNFSLKHKHTFKTRNVGINI